MECKFQIHDFINIFDCELIDTLWNVNNCAYDENMSTGAELIDTLWNVNLLYDFLVDYQTWN